MILNFCLHSIFREYGWQFLRRIGGPHPVRTARALLHAGRIDVSDRPIRLQGTCPPDQRSIVAVGFCMKPVAVPCPSGRTSHDCAYLEHLPPSAPPPCRHCAIRELGELTLKTGSAFYIMTSAREILTDVFAPPLRKPRFTSGLFLLCRYSVQPFAAGMLASGIRGWIFQFQQGGCRDYRSWLMADRGIKTEQTAIHDSTQTAIRQILKKASKKPLPAARYKKRGNVFFPA